MATGHIYYAECPNPDIKVEVDEDLTVHAEWVCTWSGMPYLTFHRTGLTAQCPNCGYTWEISYHEFWYGDGSCLMKHADPTIFASL